MRKSQVSIIQTEADTRGTWQLSRYQRKIIRELTHPARHLPTAISVDSPLQRSSPPPPTTTTTTKSLKSWILNLKTKKKWMETNSKEMKSWIEGRRRKGDVSDCRGESEWVSFEKSRGEESKSCVLSLVIWISSQPGSLAERGNEGAEAEGCRWREWKWELVRDGERGVSSSSVWPLSHSNSGLATWTPVPLSSPVAQNLTPSAPDESAGTVAQPRRTSVEIIKQKWGK